MDIRADSSTKAQAPVQERAGARQPSDSKKESVGLTVEKTTVSVSVSVSLFVKAGFTGISDDSLVQKLAKGHEEAVAKAKELETQLTEAKGEIAQRQLAMIDELLEVYLLISRLAAGSGHGGAVKSLAKQAERMMSLAPDAATNAQAALEARGEVDPDALAGLKELTKRIASKANILAFAVEPADGKSADGLRRHAHKLGQAVTLQAKVSVPESLNVEKRNVSFST